MLDSINQTSQSTVCSTVTASTPPAKPKRSNHTKPCAPPAGVLDIADALLRKSHVLFLCGGIADNTLTRRIANGDFPKPDMFSGRNPLWRVRTVLDWLRGEVALNLDRHHKALQRQLAEAPDSHQRAELLREHRHLLAQIRRVRRSKNTPAVAV
ncbi:helix-turn-helix transcriptional regulator [Paraburkholderia xenovorans]|uniref:helix-turn-helix transcriptional regulator n=1 Tax=Paraburkholderia xenovorans TaxID=36873 RepID=UPI0015C52662|nr:hypothetical protein [Paraburkholderia xenovorans]NPT33454.1 hypothetical protein [Paraburkholderia xenovorans]